MSKYFKLIDKSYPYENDNKGVVELWSGWNGNVNQEAREETVATIASLSYGNQEAKNPKALFNKLKKLKHESLFEFINLPTKEDRIDFSLRHQDIPIYSDFKNLDDLVEQHKATIATFKIKIPIFVARQFIRHRCFSFLELSRRYVKNKKVPFEFYEPDFSVIEDEKLRENTEDYYKLTLSYCEKTYNLLVSRGIKPEVARSIIPVGAYTTFYCQGDTECLINFFQLRLKKDAQYEIRKVAESMLDLLRKHQPALYDEISKALVGEENE